MLIIDQINNLEAPKSVELRKVLTHSKTKSCKNKQRPEMDLKDVQVSTKLASMKKLCTTKTNESGSRLYGSSSCLTKSVLDTHKHSEDSDWSCLFSSSSTNVDDMSQARQVSTMSTIQDPSNDVISSHHIYEPIGGLNSTSEENLAFQNASMSGNDTSRSLMVNRFSILADEKAPRPVIPFGPGFQAEIPEWSVTVKNGYLRDDESRRWLGTKIWPMEEDDTNYNVEEVGKGRPDTCSCVAPASTNCIRKHIAEARTSLKAEIGCAFETWKFDEMGEVVSESWTLEEEQRFKTLVSNHPLTSETNFWELALKCFPSKRRESLLNYYYNVFLARRLSLLSKTLDRVESDDDNNDNYKRKN